MKKTLLFCVGILIICGLQRCQEDVHFSEGITSYKLGNHTAFYNLHPIFAEYRALNDLKVFPTLDDGFLTYHAHERRNSFALSKYNANFEADWQLAFPLAFPKADTEENNLKEYYLYRDYESTELIGMLEVDNQLFLYFADSNDRLREFEVDARSGKVAHHFILDNIIKLDRDPECLYEVFRAQTDSRKIDVQYCFILGERGQTEVIAVERSIGTSEVCPSVPAEEVSLELSGDFLRF